VTHDCACGRPIQDTALICQTCGMLLDAAIADVCAYQGLAYDLDVALARQARLNTRDGSRPTEAAVAFDARAGRAATVLTQVITHWTRLVARETGAGTVPTYGPACRSCRHRSCREIRTRGLPGEGLAAAAAWLRPRVGWLRYHVDGPQAHEEILDAVHTARRICDRPPDRLYAGPCDCGEDLYGRLDAPYVICHGTTHDGPVAWEVVARRRWLLESARDVLATGTEISRALTRYAQPVTPSALRGYVHRGTLIARGERVEGGRMVMLYRLGDVLDILARQAERVSA
jgi:hypothetical protein